jgi:hypothetical protein
MRNNVWKKSIMIMVPLFLVVLSFASTAQAAMGANSNDDMAITSKVQEKLQSDNHLKGEDIRIETKDGEVTLKGVVASQADVIRAAKLAHYVDGVKKVDNRLTTVNSHHYGRAAARPNCQIGANWDC